MLKRVYAVKRLLRYNVLSDLGSYIDPNLDFMPISYTGGIEKSALKPNKNVVESDFWLDYDYLDKLARHSPWIRDLVEEYQLDYDTIYHWQFDRGQNQEIKLLFCLLKLITKLEMAAVRIEVFSSKLSRKLALGTLWQWSDDDQRKLTLAIKEVNKIITTAQYEVERIVKHHVRWRGQPLLLSPGLEELMSEIEANTEHKITVAQVISALGGIPDLLNISFPTRSQELCNFLVNNTLDYFKLWLRFFVEPWLDLHEAWHASEGHSVGDGDPFKRMGFFEREQYEKAMRAYAKNITLGGFGKWVKAQKSPKPAKTFRVPRGFNFNPDIKYDID